MNFLEEFLTGHKLKLLSRKVCTHLIHNSCLAHSQMTKNTKKLTPISLTACAKLIRKSQSTKNSASDQTLLRKKSGRLLSGQQNGKLTKWRSANSIFENGSSSNLLSLIYTSNFVVRFCIPLRFRQE